MAEHFLNQKMDFFYVDDRPIEKLISELNRTFAFQKVMMIGFSEKKVGQFKSKEESMCNFVFADDLPDDISRETACLVCGDIRYLNQLKISALKNAIPLILYAESYISLKDLMPLFEINAGFKRANILMGIVIDKEIVKQRVNEFSCLMQLDCFSYQFLFFENILSSLFFNSPLNSKVNNTLFELINSLEDLAGQQVNDKTYFDDILNLYFEFIMLVQNFGNNVLLLLSKITSKYNRQCNKINLQFISSQVLIEIYESFLCRITPSLVSSVCYEKHCKILKNASVEEISFEIQYDEQKFWFVLSRFLPNFKKQLSNIKNNFKNARENASFVSMPTMFDFAKETSQLKIKESLCLTADVYQEKSLLKIINLFGLLDF